MSRSGVEEKMTWQRVPRGVRQAVERALGSRVTRAMRIWGGYSPTPTFRLALADGRRAFFKATHGESNAFSTQALRAEVRVYHELGGVVGQWMPGYLATVNHDVWHGLLLEDLGPKSVPPWTPAITRGITRELAAFHRQTLDVPLPAWLARPETTLARESWPRVREESDGFERLAVWAGDAAPALVAWLEMVTPRVEALMAQPVLHSGPFALLHGDLRSDNLRLRAGKLTLFDWPAVCVGRAEWDMVAFAQTVTVEGGVLPEQVMAWYGAHFALDPAAVDSALAWWLAFFARRAWREELPGLPRLRVFQRQQFGVLAQWAARQWALPEPAGMAALVGQGKRA